MSERGGIWTQDSASKIQPLPLFQFIDFILVTQPNMQSGLSHFIRAVATTLYAFDFRACCCASASKRSVSPSSSVPLQCSRSLLKKWHRFFQTSFSKRQAAPFHLDKECPIHYSHITPSPSSAQGWHWQTTMSSFSMQPSKKSLPSDENRDNRQTYLPLCSSL